MKYREIDMEATGRNIRELRIRAGLSVRRLQEKMGFADPQAIYHWQQGKTLPNLDNLLLLSELLGVPVEEILVMREAGDGE